VNHTPNLSNQPDLDEIIPALDVESILAIHREPDGYIGFVRKPDPAHPQLDKHGKPKTWVSLFSIKAAELRSMFPAFAEWLTDESYFTVNGYYCAAPYRNKTTGLPDVWRKEKHLSTLNTCYADIDCGRPESEEPGAALHWRQAQHEAEILADRGVIPQPSIMARSGRGVYLFWLLRDAKDPAKPPHAWPEKIELYKSCNRAIDERLRAHRLPADLAAIDAARVLRVPGSIHRKALRRVTYVIQLDEYGKGFVYTLPELAKFLDLPAPDGELPEKARTLAKPAQYRRTKNPGSAPLRSRGPMILNARRAQDLLSLQTWRGGFLKRGMKYPDGTTSPGRRFILTLYANFLKGSGVDQASALPALREMAANMHPAYPSDPLDQDPPVESLVEMEYSSKTRRRWKNAKLCALLGISPDVARELDLKTIRSADVAHEADQALPLQADVIGARREWLRQFILDHPGRWTAQRVVNLSTLSPYSWNNRQTANRDLNAIGYETESRSRGGRPRKALSVSMKV
jgi:hypothetical protein